LEIRYRWVNTQSTHQLKKLPKIKLSYQDALKSIIDERKQLVFFESSVLDVDKFMISHPGTAFLIKKTIGEDIGKYIFGFSNYDGDNHHYNHTSKAINMIQHLSIGKIEAPINFFIGTSEYIYNAAMIIHSVTYGANSTMLITLISDSLKLNDICKDISWMGKYFRVTTKDSKVSRYYSSFFVDLDQWISDIDQEEAQYSKPKGSVQLIIRIYSNGKFTQTIDSLSVSQEVILSGPYGLGLSLSNLEGEFLAVVEGTGLIPFLDLIHYMFINSDTVKFKLTLYVSFANMTYTFPKALLNKVQSTLQNIFELIWFISDEDKRNPERILERLKSKDPTRVWICGPFGFNQFVYEIMRREPKIKKSKIFLMLALFLYFRVFN
jgi:NAD(P)H-flavin reductase/cytochrome b involved in lipid metabolism